MSTSGSIRRVTLATLVVLASFTLPAEATAKLEVAATLGDLAAAAREVGGDQVEVSTLARPDEDPHYVDAKPNYVRVLSNADLLVFNGLALEVGWLPELLENARNSAIQEGNDGHFDASTVVQKMGVPDTEVTRRMGDVHPDGNPHYTLDPRQMARVAIGLGKRLGELDPDHEEAYMDRARSFAKECLRTANKWEEKFESLPESRRRVVVYHESWEYVIDWLGLEKTATVEPKPGVEPNPKHVGEVVGTVQKKDVPAILKLEYYPSSTTEQIAEKTDSTVVTSQGQTRPDQDYIDRIEQLVRTLHEQLSK